MNLVTLSREDAKILAVSQTKKALTKIWAAALSFADMSIASWV